MMTSPILPGMFYRNKLLGIVLIVGTVVVDTPPYHDGFRYVDHRGSFYTEVGTVQNRAFAPFDLVEQVEAEDVPEDVMLGIRALTEDLIKTPSGRDKVWKICRKTLPVMAGVNLTLGALVVRANPIVGGIGLLAGTAGVVMHVLYPDELKG